MLIHVAACISMNCYMYYYMYVYSLWGDYDKNCNDIIPLNK